MPAIRHSLGIAMSHLPTLNRCALPVLLLLAAPVLSASGLFEAIRNDDLAGVRSAAQDPAQIESRVPPAPRP